MIETTMPLSAYLNAVATRYAAAGGRIYYPQLTVYDTSGRSIYTSHESLENSKLLRQLPGGAAKLTSNVQATQFSTIVDEIPDFRAKKDLLLGRHRLSVVSVFLQECHACSIQESTLAETEKGLLANGVDVLVIHVNRE